MEMLQLFTQVILCAGHLIRCCIVLVLGSESVVLASNRFFVRYLCSSFFFVNWCKCFSIPWLFVE